MKNISSKQLERLDVLYRKGQFNGSSVPDWSRLTHKDVSRMIANAEEMEANTFHPADRVLKEELRRKVQSGNLIMHENELRFLTKIPAGELLWIQKSSNKGQEADITKAQCRRIKVLIGQGFLRHLSGIEINSLSYNTAKELIDEGEQNALEEHKMKGQYHV